jgi:gamma-glutamylcyclotransferase (GGCT)/AIG2-like uncharacterized protein YtfP
MPSILEWTKDYGQGVGSLITAFGLVAGGFWALLSYTKSRKKESAEWLHRLFTGFYVDANAKSFRRVLEYDYVNTLLPVMEKALKDEEETYSKNEQITLTELDTVLNYLEFVLHLESRGSLARKDRDSMFGSWYKEMRGPERATLRYYLRRFSYEALAKESCESDQPLHTHEQIAFYGTLTKAGGAQEKLGIQGCLNPAGKCKIRGALVQREGFSGLVEGNESIPGELYDIYKRTVFKKLDQYEGPNYRRTVVRLSEPARDAWVYVYVGQSHPDNVE